MNCIEVNEKYIIVENKPRIRRKKEPFPCRLNFSKIIFS